MLRSKVCALCLSCLVVQVDLPELRLGAVVGPLVVPAQPGGQPVDGPQAAVTVVGRRRVGQRQKGDLVRVLQVARTGRDGSATVNHGLGAGKAVRPGSELIVPVLRDPRVALVIGMVVRVLVRGRRVDSGIAPVLKVVHRRVGLQSAPVAVVTGRRLSLGSLRAARERVPKHRAEYAQTVREPRPAASGSRADQAHPLGPPGPPLPCSGSARSMSQMNRAEAVVLVNRRGSTPDGSAPQNSPLRPHPGRQHQPVSRRQRRPCERATNAPCPNM